MSGCGTVCGKFFPTLGADGKMVRKKCSNVNQEDVNMKRPPKRCDGNSETEALASSALEALLETPLIKARDRKPAPSYQIPQLTRR